MEKLDKKQKTFVYIGIGCISVVSSIGIIVLYNYSKRKQLEDLEEKIEAGELLTDEEEIIAERRYTDDYEEYERPSRHIGGGGAVNQPYSIASDRRFKILQTHGAKPSEARARAGKRLRQAGEFDSGRRFRQIEPMTIPKLRETGRLRQSGRRYINSNL